MALPIAVQFYSVRDEAEKDFFGTLKKIKDMGYDGVEFAGLFGNAPEKIRNYCNEIGLTPVSAHVPLDDMIADAKGTLEAYKTIGCKYVAVPYITEERRPGAEKWDETVAAIKEIGAAAKEMGLMLLYHNHDFEFVKIDGEYGLDVLYNSVPADLLQTELDTCWVNIGGEVPAEYILKYTGRAPVVHLKDFVMKGKDKPQKLYELIGIEDDTESASEDDFSFKPVGYGVQDFPAILESAATKSICFTVSLPPYQTEPALASAPL